MILGENEPTREARVAVDIRVTCKEFVDRIKLGHEKTWAVWFKIMAMPDEQRDRWLKKWDEARARLEGLNDRIMVAGWKWCLYMVDKDLPKYWCLVCPCRPFPPPNQPDGCAADGIELVGNRFVYEEGYLPAQSVSPEGTGQ